MKRSEWRVAVARLLLVLPVSILIVAVPAAIAGRGGPVAPERVIRVGPERAHASLASAARAAKSGDVVEVDAGIYVGDVAVWTQDDLVIRAVGGRARVTANGRSAEGKAIFVIKGDGVRVEGFVFEGARVPGRNGAGLRHEGGRLTVRDCLFEKNEMGILTWNDERAELVVERSEFRFNAVASTHRAGDPIGHQLYVGTIGHFTLSESYVHDGAFGHLVKSRARENRIVDNRLTDGATGRASYELEFPSGGVAVVLGNVIGQGPHTENEDLISFGAEGYRWPRNELDLAYNTLVDAVPGGGTFVRVRSGADRVIAVNNLLVGEGRFEWPETTTAIGNARAGPADLPRAVAGDYRLSRRSALVGSAVDPGEVIGAPLRLEREYVHPRSSRALAAGARSPGALQRTLP